MPATIRTLAKQLQVGPEEIDELIYKLVNDGSEPFTMPLPMVKYYDLPLTVQAVKAITNMRRHAMRSVIVCRPCRRMWELEDVAVYKHPHACDVLRADRLPW